MTLTSGEPPVYSNGRLILDEEMALDLESLLRLERIRLLESRSDLIAAGLAGTPAVKHFDERLTRLKKLRKRLDALMEEKSWGSPGE